METPAFTGFPPEAMTFLQDLQAHNDRTWFAENKPAYEHALRAPAEAFAAAIRPRLEALAERPLSAKIFRIHRDVRFSRDKSPYNTHLRMGFTPQGDAAAGGGFYFSLEPDHLVLGVGAFELPGPALDRFRAAVADETRGGALADLIAGLPADGYRLDEPALKRVPAPWPADHPRAHLLRRKGLTAWREIHDRARIEGPGLLDEAMATFRVLAPVNRWLAPVLAG